MLSEGRIPLNDAEKETIEEILNERAGENISLTRRDPGETGPVLLHIGDDTFEVDEDGTVS